MSNQSRPNLTAPTPADRIAELEALVAKLLARIRYLENIWMERFGELE
jgi:hypothetical protein